MINRITELYKKYKEIINYVIVGGCTTVVSIASFYIVRFFILTKDNQLHIQIATIISWILAVLFAFFANKKYVFESKKKGKGLLLEMIKFFLSRLTTLLIEMISMWILTSPLSINDRIAKILVQFIILVLNYLFSKLFVFKKHT
ncbi:MAG: GtrA family protein [Bacilli bacterium]|nr:GtrA family protein [Bacilli bacterium]